MINDLSLKAVAGSSFGTDGCKPLYGSYCFSQIPRTISRLLTGKGKGLPVDCTIEGRYDSVILLLIDGFGWQFLEKNIDRYPFLQRFLKEGIISKITSQFPSTTAAHVTCLNTGLEVGQSGVYEWFYYEPILDQMISPLLFSFAGDKEIGTLKKMGASPQDIYPNATFYQGLKQEGISSYVFQNEHIATSPYSSVLFQGSENCPYADFGAGLSSLAEATSKGGYFYLYFGDIDSKAHRHGLESDEVRRSADFCFQTLESVFLKKLSKNGKKTALMVAADHGMTSIDPLTTFYLNEKIPSLSSYICKNKAGQLLVPAGSCRDFFMHIEEEKKEECKALLTESLKGIASVYETEELIKAGLFGEAPPSKRFLDRVGNLVLLPFQNQSVWWYQKKRFEQKFYAMHGGLSREEMESIFLFLEL